jgi:hypothetical protein
VIPAISAAPAPPQRRSPDLVGVEVEVADTAATVQDAVTSAMRQAEEAIRHAAHVGRSVAVAFAPGGAPRTLVLPGEQMKPEEADQMSEDLTVMSRILDKATARDGEESRMFSGLRGWSWKGRGGAEALYLDGFGALFLLAVDFPLMPAGKAEMAKEEEATDSTWETAKRELHGGPPWDAPLPPEPFERQTAEFRKAWVDELREDLVATLKHATNIRGLRDAETVAVAVFGPSAGSAERREVTVRKGSGNARAIAWSNTAAGGTVMTLRAKRADVAALAKGTIDQAEFSRRVTVSVR